MAMSVGTDGGDQDTVIAAINTTPLVDVMLVLLIIFLITIPVVTHSINVKLPKEKNKPYVTKPQNIILSVDKKGDIYWNLTRVPNTQALLKKLDAVAEIKPQPELHIRGDQDTPYENIGKVILTAQRAGITKLSFVVQPPGQLN